MLGAVVGVEHARDVFRCVLGLHRAHVVALVEGVQVDAAGGARGPQPHGGHAAEFMPRHAGVVGGGDHVVGLDPAHLPVGLHQAPAKLHRVAEFRAHEFPGVAVDQPVVGLFHLATVNDALREHAVVVADAVAHAGHAHGGHGVQKARGQAPQAAVAQSGVGFQIDQRVEVDPELGAGGARFVEDADREQRVRECAPGQELHRQVVHTLGVVVLRGGEGLAPAVHHAVAHGVEEGKQPVASGGRARIAAQRVDQPVGDRLAQGVHAVVEVVVFERDRADGVRGVRHGSELCGGG